MYTWFKHKEADGRKDDPASSSESPNGHKYLRLQRDEDGDDIELGTKEKEKD
jgi:hypothetical protein